jgi:hypothetical protein
MTNGEFQFDRKVIVFVRDADNHLVEDSTITWTRNDKPGGKIDHSEGRGEITVTNEKDKIEVCAEYQDKKEKRLLALDQTSCTIVFHDLHTRPGWRVIMEKHFPAFIGIAFILIAVVLTFSFSSPNSLQIHVILAVLALGGGAFGTEISGMIKTDLKLGEKFVIGATGAAAIFVILYFAVPAS